MQKLNFIFSIHNHQPVGNFSHIFEEVYQKAYKPFLDVLEKYPQIKVTLHYTGILLDWLYKNHPEFLERLRKAVKSNQVELLSGAYYEAIISIIPPGDRILQIQKLSKRISELFDFFPEGMWLAERVWEQPIAKEIVGAGIKFIPIDEAHFIYAGLNPKKLLGYYITEEQGKLLYVFPCSKKLRYTIPFAPIEETIEWLWQKTSEDENSIIVFADDGEKFGSWPNTFEHVYKNGWLENFFSKIIENKHWINLMHFSDAIKNIPPKAKVYLPDASYPEMLKWALPPDAIADFEKFEKHLESNNLNDFSVFIRSGYWRNFLAKYPEANWMHKRMLRVSEKINNSKSPKIFEAQENLLAAQCNDAYWHGVFGGLYLPNLRFSIYENLIKAEKIVHGNNKIEQIDLDCDGENEIVLETETFNIFFKPDRGGAIFEIDYKPLNINLLDLVNRRVESSHLKLKEKVISGSATEQDMLLYQSLFYDWYQHASFVDHFFDNNTTPEEFYKSSYRELGDFVCNPYKVSFNQAEEEFRIEMSREGIVSNDLEIFNVKIVKTFTIKSNSSEIIVKYKLINLENKTIDLRFGVELNFALQAGDASDRYYSVDGLELIDKRLRSMGSLNNLEKLSLIDEWQKLRIDLNAKDAYEIWRLPLETVSLSEAGLEKLYQSSIVIPIWKISLKDEWETTINQEIRKI